MALSRLTLRQLEAFTAVAEQRSFADAANRLSLSSSAVSQLVSELESTLGFRLFDRSTRRVDLSGAGQEYLASAHAVLRHVVRAEAVAADVRNRAAGTVRIGAPLVISSMLLPGAIRAFAADRPKVVLRIVDTPVDSLVDAVAHAEVDLAIGPDRRHGPELASQPIFDSPWVLWCAPSHPSARRRTVRWRQLREVPLVAAGRDHEHSVAQMHASLPDHERIRPTQIVENITTALGIAAEGMAATLAPEYVGVLADHFGLVKRRVVDPEVIRRVCLYQPTARTVTPAAEAFGAFLAEWLSRRIH